MRTQRAIIIILLLFAARAQAQPMLPDMAGVSEKGVNILTWTCQYDGIKSIAVQRSSDSVYNFSTAGYVKNTKKGVQVFVDGHPKAGYNFYELIIVFGSDLSWTSNRIKLYVDSNIIKNQTLLLPSNDSLQRYITTSSRNDKETSATKGYVNTTYGNRNNGHKKEVIIVGTKDQDIVTSIDSSLAKIVSKNDSVERKQPKITISLVADATDIDALSYVKSEYVFIDQLSGHITLKLPETRAHSYAVKFLNSSNKVVMEVPHMAEPVVILDKRNFRNKGMYKFVLKRDNKEFETGFITLY